VTTYQVTVEPAQRDALVSSWDGGSLPVLGPELPDHRKREGEHEAIAFVSSIAAGASDSEIAVTIDSLDQPVGANAAPSVTIRSLAPVIDDDGKLVMFLAETDQVDDRSETPERTDGDPTLESDDDEIDASNFIEPPELPPAVKAELGPELSANIESGVVRLEDLDAKIQTRIALTKGGKDRPTMLPETQFRIRAETMACGGNFDNPAQKCEAYIRQIMPEFNVLNAQERTAIISGLLLETGIASIPQPHVEIHNANLGRQADPRSVPIASTSGNGGRTGTGGTPVVDLRGLPGRNKLERSIEWLKANRNGFEKISWERQVELGSELLQTSGGILDEVG
jgi:hypothetical protein